MKQRKQLLLSKRQGTGGSTLSRRLAYMLLLLVTLFAGGSSAWADSVHEWTMDTSNDDAVKAFFTTSGITKSLSSSEYGNDSYTPTGGSAISSGLKLDSNGKLTFTTNGTTTITIAAEVKSGDANSYIYVTEGTNKIQKKVAGTVTEITYEGNAGSYEIAKGSAEAILLYVKVEESSAPTKPSKPTIVSSDPTVSAISSGSVDYEATSTGNYSLILSSDAGVTYYTKSNAGLNNPGTYGSGTWTERNSNTISGTLTENRTISIVAVKDGVASDVLSINYTYEAIPTFTITYNLNGHGDAIADVTNATALPATLPTPTATGYEFGGWYTNEGLTDAAVAGAEISANTTLYAKWTAKEYEIKYYHQGGTSFTSEEKTSLPTRHTYGTTTTLVNPTKDGYTFDGWFDNAECTGSAITEIGAEQITANINIYAKWTSTTPDPEPIAGDAEVWFVYLKDKDNAGTTQSTIFKDANGNTMKGLAKATSTDISGSITINGKTFNITGRGSAGNKADISFTVPSGKTATLYGLASSAGTTARPLTLSCTDPAYSDVQYTSASKTEAADFKFENLVPGEYKLTSDANVAVEFLYLDLQGASNPVISTQPVGATYEYGATATALTVAAAPANGGVLSYQWYKSANADGSNPESLGTESTCTPSTDAVGTSYYYCVVTEANGGNVKSGIATVVVNKAKNTLAVSSNNVSIVKGENVIISYTTNSNAAVIYGSNAASIASVENNSQPNSFKINGTTVGTTTVTVSQNANYNYEAATQTINVTVVSSPVETVFYRDFKDNNWADAEFKQGNTTNADVNYDVTTYAKHATNRFSWNSTDGLVGSGQNVGADKYYIEIPIEKINGEITVTIGNTCKNITAFLYDSNGQLIARENNNACTAYKKTTTNGVSTFTIGSLTTTSGTLKFGCGESGNGNYTSILITTPTPNGLTTPPSVSVSPTSSTVGTDETVTLTATATDAYSYKWYKNTTNSTTGGTEIYGETIHELKVTPTEVGTYYYYCVGVNSKGETVSTNVATVDVVAVPVLNFAEAEKIYDKNKTSWNEGVSPVLTITPASIPAATLTTLFANVQYTTSESGFTYSAPNGVGQLSDITTQGTGFTITAKLTVNDDVPGIKNGTYTASFKFDIVDGYSDKLTAGEAIAVGDKRIVKDDDDNTILTLTFGGWTHGSNGATWKQDDNDPEKTADATEVTDRWPNAGTSGSTAIDGYDQVSQGKTDSRSETKGKIEWEVKDQKIKPYSLPCRGCYFTVTPEKNGKLTIYLEQNGCVNESGSNYGLISGSPRVYYWFDSEGNCIPCDVTPKVTQKLTYATGSTLNGKDNFKKQVLDTWGVDLDAASSDNELYKVLKAHWVGKSENDVQDAIPYEGGYFLMKEAMIKYTVTLLAGKTYYFFSNNSKMGYSGLNFAPSHDGSVEIGLPQGGTETVNTVEALALNDEVNFSKPGTTTAYDEVTLNRTFKANTWNTICLPFSVSKEQVERVFGEGTVFVGYNGFTNNTLHLVYHAYDYLLPGQPYFIKPTGTNADLNNIVFENVTITSNAAVKDNDGKNDSFEFVGLFNGKQLNTYDHYMNGSGNIAFSSTKKVDLKGYRAYLKNNTNGAAQVKAIAYANFDDDMDEPTSIDGLIEYLESEGVNVVPAGGVYNLSGQKVADEATNLPAGLYIINGKKVVIK